MAIHYTAKIPFKRIIKIGIWDNSKDRATMSTIYSKLKNLYPEKEVYIINGGYFNMVSNWSACWGLRINGKDLASNWPFSAFMAMNQKTIQFFPSGNIIPYNFSDGVTGYPALIENGKKSPEYHEAPDGKNDRGRSMLGYNDNEVIISCISDTAGTSDFTLKEELNFMLGQKCKYAINLDGGGSSQCNFDGKAIYSGRKVYDFVYVIAEPDLSDPRKAYQHWLNLNYSSNLVVDGILGNASNRATIKAMQKEVKVVADGIWGNLSSRAFGYLSETSPYNTENKIKLLQGALMRKGYWNALCDGKFNNTLTNQIILYQRANRLVADGIVGAATITSLFR